MIPIAEDFYHRASVMLDDSRLVNDQFNILKSFENPNWTQTWYEISEQFRALAHDSPDSLKYTRKQCASLAIGCYPANIDQNRKHCYSALKQCYKKLCANEGYPINYDSFNYASSLIPFTIRKTKNSIVRGTIIMIRGLDSFKEVRYWNENVLLENGFNIVGIDFPGMGENPIPMNKDSDQVFKSLIHYIKDNYQIGSLTLCWGLGFGGYWAHKLAINESNLIDGAINQGGPVHYGFKPNLKKIIFNYSEVKFLSRMIQLALKEKESTAKFISKLSLRDSLEEVDSRSQVLYINGDLDKTASIKEFNLLKESPNCEAIRVKGAGHLAINALDSAVIPIITDWILSLESQSTVDMNKAV